MPRFEYCSRTGWGIPHCVNLSFSFGSILDGVVINDGTLCRDAVERSTEFLSSLGLNGEEEMMEPPHSGRKSAKAAPCPCVPLSGSIGVLEVGSNEILSTIENSSLFMSEPKERLKEGDFGRGVGEVAGNT